MVNSGAIEQATAGSWASDELGWQLHAGLGLKVIFSQPKLRMTHAHTPIAGSRPIHSRARSDRSLLVEALAGFIESIPYFTSTLL